MKAETYFDIAINECEPHLEYKFTHAPAVVLSSPFTKLDHLRSAASAAITATRLPVLLMEHSNTNDANSAIEWTRNAIERANIVVVLLPQWTGTYPFGDWSLVSPFTFFETEVRLSVQTARHVLGYYVGLHQNWPDAGVLPLPSAGRFSSCATHTPIHVVAMAARLQESWFREPSTVRELMLWITNDVAEAAWASTPRGRVFWGVLKPFGIAAPGRPYAQSVSPVRRRIGAVAARWLARACFRPQLSADYLFRQGSTFGFRSSAENSV